MPFSVGWSLQAELMLLFRWTHLRKHLQEMLTDLHRIIVIGSADEAEGFRHSSCRFIRCLFCLALLQAHPEYLLYILRRQIRKAMQHVISARFSRHSFKVSVVYP